MATEVQGIDITLPAAGDESAEQHTFYLVDANGRADQCTTNDGTDVCIGVLQNKPAAQDRGARLRTCGITKLVAGAAVNEGDTLRPDATGRGIATTTDGHIYGAIALTPAAGADEVIEALVTGPTFRGA